MAAERDKLSLFYPSGLACIAAIYYLALTWVLPWTLNIPLPLSLESLFGIRAGDIAGNSLRHAVGVALASLPPGLLLVALRARPLVVPALLTALPAAANPLLPLFDASHAHTLLDAGIAVKDALVLLLALPASALMFRSLSAQDASP